MTTVCLCKDCGKKRTRHYWGLCVECFKRRFGFHEGEPGVENWNWDVDEAA